MVVFSAVARIFAHSLSLSIAFALPSNLGNPPVADQDVTSIVAKFNISEQSPLPGHTVKCLRPRRVPVAKLVPSDCIYVINQMLLQEPNVSLKRLFKRKIYMTDDDTYRPSRWQHGNCELSVVGYRDVEQWLSLFDVSLTANSITRKCITRVINSAGGIGAIGDVRKGFSVLLQGYGEPESISEKSLGVSQRPAVSVSRRTMESQHNSDDSAASQAIEARYPLVDLSLGSTHRTGASNSTLSLTARPRYPVQCFNPYIMYLPPATAADCSYIMNEIILRLFDPMRELTFGYTDDADINLSKPEYQQWQSGNCMIAVRNYHEPSFDTFRLVDVTDTARRISAQCLVFARQPVGGIGVIGTLGRGFYMYVGGRLDSNLALDNAMLLREGLGAESR